jgi:Family of unknown function (DUF6636)
MRRRRLYPAILALAALALAACGGDAGDKTVVVHKTVTDKAPTQASTTAATPSTTVPAAPPRHLRGFQSPSQNIGCYMSAQFGGNVRCDIRERSWTPPPKPANCELDWGQGVAFHGSGKAGVVCAGDTTLDKTAPVLAYGQTSQAGPVQCHSAEAGVTCANADSGHGFFLSRQSYRVF